MMLVPLIGTVEGLACKVTEAGVVALNWIAVEAEICGLQVVQVAVTTAPPALPAPAHCRMATVAWPLALVTALVVLGGVGQTPKPPRVVSNWIVCPAIVPPVNCTVTFSETLKVVPLPLPPVALAGLGGSTV